MSIAQYLRSLRRDDMISWRAMWIGMIRYQPDPAKAQHYRGGLE